jgi:tetratricopeptide (TPR) repeat protein
VINVSQLEVPSLTALDSIPVGRRITEIMNEKGPAYTISAMSNRLGFSRETLRLKLKGEREMYTFELENIAKDLKVSVDRIMQTDIFEETKELRSHLDIGSNMHRCLELSAKFTELAIGLTERVIVANELARGYYQARDIQTAIETLKKVLPDAQLILEKYGEPHILMWVTGNLISAKTIEGEYTNLLEMAAQVEPYFQTNPKLAAVICYCIAQYKFEEEGDIAGARENHYQSLHYYQQHGVPISVANSQLNVAIFEDRQKRYDEAKQLFRSALDVFRVHDNLYAQAVHAREYGKLLIRLGELAEAIEVVDWVIARIQAHPNVIHSDMEAQLNLLLAIAKQDMLYAETILDDKIGSKSVQKIANKLIIDHYDQHGTLTAKAQHQQRFAHMQSSPIDLLLDVSSGTSYLLTLLDFCIRHRWN